MPDFKRRCWQRTVLMEPGGRLEKSSCKLLNNARSVAVRGVVSALLESKFEEIALCRV